MSNKKTEQSPLEAAAAGAKRQSPRPSPETEALRAVRKLRQLKERYEATVKAQAAEIKRLQDEANAVRAGLSAEARAIVAMLDAGTSSEAAQ